MDIELHCYVCGQECCIEGVEDVVLFHGLMETWASVHKHPADEMEAWRNAELAREEYMAKHIIDDDEDLDSGLD